MPKRSKRYRQAAELVEEGKHYTLEEAAELIAKFPAAKFDQTVTVSAKMGVDPKKSDQMVRGTCPLPHGSGKDVRVIVFAQGEAATAAKNAGANEVGYEQLIEKVKGGYNDFDIAVATPDAMAEVRKLGKQLGPRGLMPNPKTGTVTDNTAEAVQAVKAGRVDYKLDKNGNVAVTVGKVSFSADKIVENTKAVLESINSGRPATAKGNFIQSITLAATMSPGVALDASPYQVVAVAA